MGADRTRSVDQLNADFAIPWSGSISPSCGEDRMGGVADIYCSLASMRGPAVRGWVAGGWQDWHTLRTLSEAARAELSTHMHITA